MKKKNVLRMINFDAEVATVVRTTIARSDMNKYTFQNYSFVAVFVFLPRNKCFFIPRKGLIFYALAYQITIAQRSFSDYIIILP